MAALAGAPAAAGDPDPLAQGLYDAIMERATGYHGLNEPRVMAACIDWHAQNRMGVFVHNLFVTYTDVGTDVPVFISRLANDAELRCTRWRDAEKTDCDCQVIDMNGKNVLEVPPGR